MFTVYNEKEEKFQLVEEPDASLQYTYADYLQWKFEERVELIKGQIFKMSPAPNMKHQQVSGRIFGELYSFFKEKKCKLFCAPFDVRLPISNNKKDKEITTVVQPDICVVCDETKLDSRGCCGAPDLIIEILSPGNTKKEIKTKFKLYEESSVKEYWVVYPTEESIAVFVLTESKTYSGAKIYTSGDVIESSAVKGMKISVDDVFSR